MTATLPTGLEPPTFQRSLLRGLAVLMPPLLTIVILNWAFHTVEEAVWQPVHRLVRRAAVWSVEDVRDALPTARATADPTIVECDGAEFKRLESGQFVPRPVYARVIADLGGDQPPATAQAVYGRYVDLVYLRPSVAIPIFVASFLGVVYLLGRFIAARVGKAFWDTVEWGVQRLPLVSSVYASVKKVTDFVLTDNDLQFTRVVALQYPRQGIWSVAFATGDGISEVAGAVGDPLVAILVPTSPIPVTGYTMMIRRSELVDLDITIDQACEYFISCGVVAGTPTPALEPPRES